MLFVFDLDFTLWDAGGTWCDHTAPPYTRNNDHVLDNEGRIIELYSDVPGILRALNEKDISLAIASRTHSPDLAIRLLEMFEVRKYFSFEEIYPGSKVKHFKLLREHTRIPYQEMFFFDDEYRNVAEVGALGVNANLVNDGLGLEEIQRVPGFDDFRY